MIEVAAAAVELIEPAQDIEELYARLIEYTGQTIHTSSPRGERTYRNSLTGNLDRVQFIDRNDDHELWFTVAGGPEMRAGLSTTFRVRIDGRWKVIHEPATGELVSV